MTKKLATVFKNNDIYLIGGFTLSALFGIIILLLGAVSKDVNWVYGSIAVFAISFLIILLTIVLGIFGIIDAVKERKLKKVNNN